MKINKNSIILLFFILINISFAKAHPFYVSICQIDFNENTEALEISVKVFADDLLLGLSEKGHKKLYLGEEKEDPKSDEYIYSYLQEALKLEVNDTKVNYNYVGRELEKDVVWIYLEVENVSGLQHINVECSLLTEVLEDQSNIIQLNNGETLKNLLLNKRKKSGKLEF